MTHDGRNKKQSNPNVMLETGYAISAIGRERIIPVMNTTHGEPTDLPSDFQGSEYPIRYELSCGQSNIDYVQESLAEEICKRVAAVIEFEHKGAINAFDALTKYELVLLRTVFIDSVNSSIDSTDKMPVEECYVEDERIEIIFAGHLNDNDINFRHKTFIELSGIGLSDSFSELAILSVKTTIERLVANGILWCRHQNDNGYKYSYRLTCKGKQVVKMLINGRNVVVRDKNS